MYRLCPICSRKFIAKKRTSTYCSKPCKGLATRKRIKVICDGCKNVFEKIPYQIRKTNYCSSKCYWYSTKIKQNKLCKICQKVFTPSPAQIRHGYGIYCSRKCQNKINKDSQIFKKCFKCGLIFKKSPAVARRAVFCSKTCHDLFMSDFEVHTCVQCLKDFQIPTWEVKKRKGKFCSRECFIKFKGESSLEEIVREYLEKRHVQFKQEVKFGRYRADFLLIRTKSIIECDGEYWHLNQQAVIRDSKKDLYLKNLGYQVFRLTGTQIINSLEPLIESIIIA